MKKTLGLAAFAAALAVTACGVAGNSGNMTKQEIDTITSQGQIMRVLTIEDHEDSLVLRSQCEDFTDEDLQSEAFAQLAAKMIATVTSPEQDGVGIAGPQVGLKRRVIAVQRFDKEGEPFEIYPNARISATRGDKAEGPEGCLSIPGRRGTVMRYRDVDVTYRDPKTLKDTTESVQGYSAIIFQHECDHLDGVLYIDKLVQELPSED